MVFDFQSILGYFELLIYPVTRWAKVLKKDTNSLLPYWHCYCLFPQQHTFLSERLVFKHL
jgi:hypothetical protein